MPRDNSPYYPPASDTPRTPPPATTDEGCEVCGSDDQVRQERKYGVTSVLCRACRSAKDFWN